MKLSAKKWLILFAATALLLAVALAAFNFITDPFGAFGDRFFSWWSYDATNNPRVAKLSYLEQHHSEYDSYIIGCSSTSSFPKEALDRYFHASFYNLIMYGADMLDVEQLSRYLAEHYTVKHLVVNVYLDNGAAYDEESNRLTHGMPRQATGESPLTYYPPFLFADPSYGLDKLKKLREDEYLQAAHDVFDEASGAYDKSSRDVEPIGDMDAYLRDFPVFADYKTTPRGLYKIDETMASLARIRDLCARHGITLTVVTAPVYYDYLDTFDPDQVERFYQALAEVTPYWDFSISSVSREPRYFYDGTHFRNCVGSMALARMFGDDSVYIPEDFGVYITPENAAEHTASFRQIPPPDPQSYTARVPILMYHHLAEVGSGSDTISLARFTEQIRALSEAGYRAVTFDDLSAYVRQGTALPEKPVVITFDDGYDSNRLLAAPVLEQYRMTATVFPIGVSVGKDAYKDTGVPMLPHFSAEQAAETEARGVLRMGSHGYDLHEVEGRDPAPIRQGALRRQEESEEAYIAMLRADCAAMNRLFGHPLKVFAYPFGKYTRLTEVILAEEGIEATVTVNPGVNTLVKGIPQCLRAMDRIAATESLTPAALLELVAGGE